MATNISGDEFLRSLDKWGVDWRFYKDKADWLAHNRNAAGNNVPPNGTPGGFGPLRGVVAHNTASTAQLGMIDYLYRGDSARKLPGPLASAGILKTGKAVLLGWGTTNHAGPGDPKTDALVRKNALPLDREVNPTTAGPSDPSAVLLAPYYLGFEMCHAAEGPTTAQYRTAVLFTCACLDVMGGPAYGYGAGSFAMHREFTTTRSDPQGVAKAQFRRDVAAQLKAGPPKPPPTPTWEDDDMLSPEALAQVRAIVREELDKFDTANEVWTGHNVVYDVRDTDTPTTRVTPSTLLEELVRRTRPKSDPVPPPQ